MGRKNVTGLSLLRLKDGLPYKLGQSFKDRVSFFPCLIAVHHTFLLLCARVAGCLSHHKKNRPVSRSTELNNPPVSGVMLWNRPKDKERLSPEGVTKCHIIRSKQSLFPTSNRARMTYNYTRALVLLRHACGWFPINRRSSAEVRAVADTCDLPRDHRAISVSRPLSRWTVHVIPRSLLGRDLSGNCQIRVTLQLWTLTEPMAAIPH